MRKLAKPNYVVFMGLLFVALLTTRARAGSYTVTVTPSVSGVTDGYGHNLNLSQILTSQGVFAGLTATANSNTLTTEAVSNAQWTWSVNSYTLNGNNASPNYAALIGGGSSPAASFGFMSNTVGAWAISLHVAFSSTDGTNTWSGSNDIVLNINVYNAIVTFDKAEVRPGLYTDAHPRTDSVNVTITRANNSSTLTFNLGATSEDDFVEVGSSPSSITLPAGGSYSVTQTVTVSGLSPSEYNQDAQLDVTETDNAQNWWIPATVTYPLYWMDDAIENTHSSSTQVVVFIALRGFYADGIKLPTVFTFYDQVGGVLGAPWAGVSIQENVNSTGWGGFTQQTPSTAIDANGHATDAVSRVYGNYPTSAAATADLGLAIPNDSRSSSIIYQMIDTHLSGATTVVDSTYPLNGTNGRTVSTTNTSTANVTDSNTEPPPSP